MLLSSCVSQGTATTMPEQATTKAIPEETIDITQEAAEGISQGYLAARWPLSLLVLGLCLSHPECAVYTLGCISAVWPVVRLPDLAWCSVLSHSVSCFPLPPY